MPRVALVLLVAWAPAGCSVTVGHLAMVSTRVAEPRPAASGTPSAGRSCVPVLLVFPVGPLPNLGDAVERAIAQGAGTALTDVVVRYRVVYVPPLFGWGCYVVEGTVS